MGHVISNSHYLLNLFHSFAGTWMLHAKVMMTIVVTLVPSSLLAQKLLPVHWTDKNSTLKVLPNPNLFRWYPLDISWGTTLQDICQYCFSRQHKTLFLEKKRRISSSKQTKHIKAKYFFIQYYYQMGEINFCYCTTDNMWTGILTNLFRVPNFIQYEPF